MRVLWLSRHTPTSKQIEELKKIFGNELKIQQVFTTISIGEEVLALMKLYDCKEVVTVLPVNLLEQVVALGVKPIRAVMDRKFGKDGKAEFIFSHFERVEKIEVDTTLLRR